MEEGSKPDGCNRKGRAWQARNTKDAIPHRWAPMRQAIASRCHQRCESPISHSSRADNDRRWTNRIIQPRLKSRTEGDKNKRVTAGAENLKATSTTPRFGTWNNQVAVAGGEVRRAPPTHPPNRQFKLRIERGETPPRLTITGNLAAVGPKPFWPWLHVTHHPLTHSIEGPRTSPECPKHSKLRGANPNLADLLL